MNIDALSKKGEQIKVLHEPRERVNILYRIMHKHKYSFQRAFIHSAALPHNDIVTCPFVRTESRVVLNNKLYTEGSHCEIIAPNDGGSMNFELYFRQTVRTLYYKGLYYIIVSYIKIYSVYFGEMSIIAAIPNQNCQLWYLLPCLKLKW